MSNDHSTIIALVFTKTEISNQIYEGIHRLHNDGAIEVLDVCEFDIKDNGKIRFERAMTLPLIGATDGLFLEALVGLLFFHAPHSHTVERTIAELELDLNFIESLTQKALPGSSALFIHVKNSPDLSELQNLAEDSQQLFSMTLTPEQQAKLEILFHGAPSLEASSSDTMAMH